MKVSFLVDGQLVGRVAPTRAEFYASKLLGSRENPPSPLYVKACPIASDMEF